MNFEQDQKTLLAALLSLSSCTIFYSMNTTINYIDMPNIFMGQHSRPSTNNSTVNTSSDDKAASSISYILRQWQEIFWRGHRVGPASALLSGATAFYAAYHSGSGSIQQKLFIAGGCWAMAAWPFTVFVILPLNDKLHRKADLTAKAMQKGGKGVGEFEEKEAWAMLRKWTFLSKIRASLAMIAAACVIGALVV